MSSNNKWLTVREAVKRSGYNAEYITRLIRENQIQAKKISIVWLVEEKSLLAYLEKAQKMGKKRGRKPNTQ